MDFSQDCKGGDWRHPTKSTLTRTLSKTAPSQSLLPIMNVDTSAMSLQCPEALNLANVDNFPVLELEKDLLNYEIEGLTQNSLFECCLYAGDICDLENLNLVAQTIQSPEESSTICNIPAMDELYSKSEVSLESPVEPPTSSDLQIMEQSQESDYITESMNIKTTDFDYETFHNLQTLLDLESFDPATETITFHPSIDLQPEQVKTTEITELLTTTSAIKDTLRKRNISDDDESDDSGEYSSKRKKVKTSSKSTHEKYIEMRKKNNIASRRSRQIRKEKEQEMEIEEVKLQKDNKALKLTVKELEKQRDSLKNYLMKKLSELK